MLILDTNVLSALMRDPHDDQVRLWLDRQSRQIVWTTSITVMELRHGIELLAEGWKRTALEQAMDRLISEKLNGRVASLDQVAAETTGRLLATRQRAGRGIEIRDTMIAGIALAAHATLATRNTRHFADLAVPVVNPWDA
jgi:toxin FitB